MFSDVHHIGYHTDDIEKSIAFLEATFGGEVAGRAMGADGSSKMAFVQCGAVEIELIEPGDKSRLAGRTGLVLDHVGYQVADVDQAVEELRSKSVRFATSAPYTNAMGARLIYLDAETTLGTRMHITERKPR